MHYISLLRLELSSRAAVSNRELSQTETSLVSLHMWTTTVVTDIHNSGDVGVSHAFVVLSTHALKA